MPTGEKLRAWGRIVVRDAFALCVGVAVAVALVSLCQFVETTFERGLSHDEANYMFKTKDLVAAAAIGSVINAIFVLLICVPVWLLLRKLGLDGWLSATLLGFLAAFASWILMWWDTSPISSLLDHATIYGLCGAIAGLATWWVRRRADRTF